MAVSLCTHTHTHTYMYIMHMCVLHTHSTAIEAFTGIAFLERERERIREWDWSESNLSKFPALYVSCKCVLVRVFKSAWRRGAIVDCLSPSQFECCLFWKVISVGIQCIWECDLRVLCVFLVYMFFLFNYPNLLCFVFCLVECEVFECMPAKNCCDWFWWLYWSRFFLSSTLILPPTVWIWIARIRVAKELNTCFTIYYARGLTKSAL